MAMQTIVASNPRFLNSILQIWESSPMDYSPIFPESGTKTSLLAIRTLAPDFRELGSPFLFI